MLTILTRRCHVPSRAIKFIACAFVGVSLAILFTSDPRSGCSVAQTTTAAKEVSSAQYPTLGPWRRTRDGWQILDASLQKSERSSVSQAVMLLHPIVGASFMTLVSVFALIAFDRDSEL